jgi:hypothetical protein
MPITIIQHKTDKAYQTQKINVNIERRENWFEKFNLFSPNF